MTRRAWVVVLLCTGLAAQGEVERSSELSRTQRQLQQNRADVERLLDARMRHDLGLPGEEVDGGQRGAAPTTPEAMERARQELRDQDATTAQLLERYNQLRAAVDQLRNDAAARMEASQADPFVVVPPAGSAPARKEAPSAASAAAPPAAAGPETAPNRGAAADAAALPPALEIDRVRSRIHGSTDHQRVAQSLFKAAQTLMDRATDLRAQHPAAADELDARAKEKLARALDELEPLLTAKEPPLPALFYQGRCRELMFRLAERHEGLSLAKTPGEFQKREQQVREPLLAVTARDVRKTGVRGESEVMGMWGLAAQTAMDHFVWMNRNSGYMPRAPIASITWSGEQER